MKAIVTIPADLDTTPLGTRSRLADTLEGVPVLRRTVERIAGAKQVNSVHVLCPARQAERCRSLLRGTQAFLRPFDAPPAPWASLVQTARKWSLDGWRGGIGGTTHFDEYTDARLIPPLLDETNADAVLSVSPAAVLIDPDLADQMIEHYEKHAAENRLTFTQAPPGLAALVLAPSLVRELAEKNIPVGWVFAYKPDTPEKDLTFQPCCFEAPSDARHALGRLVADTDRATDRVEAWLQRRDAPDVRTIGRWLLEQEDRSVERMPREVEIELTTDDPYPEALLQPRGSLVQSREPMDLRLLEQVIQPLLYYDDALVVLGGFGDPLRHPQLAAALETIRSLQRDGRTLLGLAIRTTAVDLTDEHIEALIGHHVDILEVRLDAWTPECYARLQAPSDPGRADLRAVLRRLDRLAERRGRHHTVKPIVVPTMTKARDNVHELDDFHDGWLRRLGAVAIEGYSHRASQCHHRSVISMAPPRRSACRRLRTRCVVLADGRVTLCDQDFNGRETVGRIGEQSLEDVWNGERFERVREAHRREHFDVAPLCAACDEWHRP